MDLGLTGRVALVSGGSSGIGRAIAEQLLREGAVVSIAGRDPERLEATLGVLSALGPVSGQPLDLRDRAAVTAWVDASARTHGALHVVVTNAGGPPAGPSGQFGREQLHDAFDLSVAAHIGLVQAAVPHLCRAGWGRVIMIASETVRAPIPEYALSNIVRPALVGYAKTLVRELGSAGVTVNVLAPGFTATAPLLRTLPSADDDERRRQLRRIADDNGIPLGRVAEPREIAAVATFLAGEPAAFVTGTVQMVDGGRALGV